MSFDLSYSSLESYAKAFASWFPGWRAMMNHREGKGSFDIMLIREISYTEAKFGLDKVFRSFAKDLEYNAMKSAGSYRRPPVRRERRRRIPFRVNRKETQVLIPVRGRMIGKIGDRIIYEQTWVRYGQQGPKDI